MAEAKQAQTDYRHIIRVADTDLDGAKPLYHALNKIKGVSFVLANAICNVSQIDRLKKAGTLNQNEVQKLTDIIKNPLKYGIPTWLLNRRKDMETGDDRHLIGADLRWQIENDLKMMKKVKSYRGVRHMSGLPVRGQKTKNNFRKKKGKQSLGVQRKKPGQPKGGAKGGKK